MRCERCNRLCQDNPAGVPRLTEVTIKGRRAVFCDDCGRNVSAIYEVTEPKVVAEAKAKPSKADDSDWVHKGGGYYENTKTGQTRRGKPDDEEEEGAGDDPPGDEAETPPAEEGEPAPSGE